MMNQAGSCNGQYDQHYSCQNQDYYPGNSYDYVQDLNRDSFTSLDYQPGLNENGVQPNQFANQDQHYDHCLLGREEVVEAVNQMNERIVNFVNNEVCILTEILEVMSERNLSAVAGGDSFYTTSDVGVQCSLDASSTKCKTSKKGGKRRKGKANHFTRKKKSKKSAKN